MKKLFFVAAAVVGLVNVNAQEKTLDPQFGVKTSLNLSSFNGKDVHDTEYRVGLQAGLYAHFPLNERVAIQPEVNYSRIGGKLKTEEVVNNLGKVRTSDRTTLDYITVPVMFKYYPGASRFNIEAGAQIGFNIYASNESKEKISNGTVVKETIVKTDMKSEVENIDFGVNFGVGYNVTDNINVGVRYYMGLTKVGDRNSEGSSLDIKNNSFVLGVGYSF